MPRLSLTGDLPEKGDEALRLLREIAAAEAAQVALLQGIATALGVDQKPSGTRSFGGIVRTVSRNGTG